MIMKNIHVLTTLKPSRLLKGLQGIRLFKNEVSPDNQWCVNVNISITNDEELKDGDKRINNYQRKPKGEEIPSKKIILTTDQDLIKEGVQAIDDEFLEWFVKNPSCEEVEVLKYKSNNMRKMNLGYKIILPKEETKTAWVGVLHDKLNEYYPAEYELKDIYQGEGCLPNFPNEELCQIWCDSKYKEEPNYNMKQEILDEMKKQETLEEGFYRIRKSIDYEEFDFTSFEFGAKWQQQNSYSGEYMKQFGDWCRNGLLNTEYGFEKLDEHLEQWKQLKKK